MNDSQGQIFNNHVLTGLNTVSMYDVETHVAELYDAQEAYTDDVELIRSLVGQGKPLRILEPFCGTGRIFIPLALDGHSAVGIDRAKAMIDRARQKCDFLHHDVQQRTRLITANVLGGDWPTDFDLVILGGNCLYELATAEEQERCVARASHALKRGGYLYLDNNHMEGALRESWQRLDVDEKAFPTGKCEDGTQFQTRRERIWFDITQRLVRYRRKTTVTFPDGSIKTEEYLVQCHPPSTGEMRTWLERHSFVVERTYGDRSGSSYEDSSNRAIFWARKI